MSAAAVETGKVPGYPQTRLALRCWRFDAAGMTIRSLNEPAKKSSWIARAMASPEGGWPRDGVLAASCSRSQQNRHEDPVPGAECSCGIYATTDLDTISWYLRKDAPVLGIVEMGGRVIPATQGYRAAYARLAAVLLIDEALTEPHHVLRKLADAYRVPALIPHSIEMEAYRDLIGSPSLAAEAEAWLRREGGGSVG